MIMTSLRSIPPDTPLAESLLDGDGRVLLPAGTLLTDKILGRLESRGIQALPIAAPATQEIDSEREASLHLRLDQLFRHAGSGPAVAALRQAIFEHRLGPRMEKPEAGK